LKVEGFAVDGVPVFGPVGQKRRLTANGLTKNPQYFLGARPATNQERAPSPHTALARKLSSLIVE
jgi:hypothetical protein